MPNEHVLDRTKLTYSQAEGLDPLPRPLKLGELSDELRALLWEVVYSSVGASSGVNRAVGQRYIGGFWFDFLKYNHVRVAHLPIDEFTNDFQSNIGWLKPLFMEFEARWVFDFITRLLRHPRTADSLKAQIAQCFETATAAHWVDTVTGTIMPGATVEEGRSVKDAIAATRDYGFDGARTHLANAAVELNDGDYAASVAESIHAVESVARAVDGKKKQDLGRILKAIDDSTGIHPALKQGFINIYGFTSDEHGIRHSLLEAKAKVDQHDAVFMLGACASFVSYLINKGREAGIFDE